MGMPPELADYKPAKKAKGETWVDGSKDPKAEEEWRQLVSIADGFDSRLAAIATRNKPNMAPYVPESAAKRLRDLRDAVNKYLKALGIDNPGRIA